MNKKQAEKCLLKSRVGEIYKNCENTEIKKQVLLKYQKLVEENDLSDKAIAVYKEKHIYPAIAIYFTYKDFGCSDEKIEEMIEHAAYMQVKSTGKFFNRIGRVRLFFSLFKKMCYSSTKFSYKQPHFDMRWIESEKHIIAWNCHKCLYHDEFQRYVCPNLTPIFCRLDDVMYGNIPIAHWERTKTIGGGDEICDFRFVKSKI